MWRMVFMLSVLTRTRSVSLSLLNIASFHFCTMYTHYMCMYVCMCCALGMMVVFCYLTFPTPQYAQLDGNEKYMEMVNFIRDHQRMNRHRTNVNMDGKMQAALL